MLSRGTWVNKCKRFYILAFLKSALKIHAFYPVGDILGFNKVMEYELIESDITIITPLQLCNSMWKLTFKSIFKKGIWYVFKWHTKTINQIYSQN